VRNLKFILEKIITLNPSQYEIKLPTFTTKPINEVSPLSAEFKFNTKYNPGIRLGGAIFFFSAMPLNSIREVFLSGITL
jgi:hypothetical protein